MPTPITIPPTNPTVFLRQPFMEHLLVDHLKQLAVDHLTNPQSVEIDISLKQLAFIKRCIQEATKHNPELFNIKDDNDEKMGMVLIDLINMTIKEPGVFGLLHGWVA